jgi:hypothetical protein
LLFLDGVRLFLHGFGGLWRRSAEYYTVAGYTEVCGGLRLLGSHANISQTVVYCWAVIGDVNVQGPSADGRDDVSVVSRLVIINTIAPLGEVLNQVQDDDSGGRDGGERAQIKFQRSRNDRMLVHVYCVGSWWVRSRFARLSYWDS